MITINKIGNNPREIGVCHTIEEAITLLNSQPEIIQSPYQRIISSEDGLLIDYGSYHSFLQIIGINYKDFTQKFRKNG